MPTVLLMLLLKLLRQQRKLLPLLACLREVEEYLQRVGDFVAAALDPLGIDVQVDVETPGGQRTTVKPSAKTDKTEEDKLDKAASPEAAKEGTPSSSDDEEWTVLSDKKPEAEAVQIPIQVLDEEVPQCTPPCQLRRAQPQGTRQPLQTRPSTRVQQLPPLPLQQPQSTLILGSRWPCRR